jgi:long-chain acyl-CoA synthetase
MELEDKYPPKEVTRMAAGDMVRRAANRKPEKIAVVAPHENREVTYYDFNQLVNKTANTFLRKGMENGDSIAIVAGNCFQFLPAFFGALKAGIVAVPINPELTAEDMGYQIDHSEAESVLVEDSLYEKVAPIVDERDVDILGSFEFDKSNVPVPEFRSMIESGSSEEPNIEMNDDEIAVILYTSGTTGRPKGVLLSNKAIYTGSVGASLNLDIHRNDVMSAHMPLFHTTMLTLIQGAMHVSATSVLRRTFNPDLLLRDIEEEGVTRFMALPMMIQQIVDRDDIADRNLSSVRKITYGMAPMGNDLLNEAIEVFGAEFQSGSGQTEAFSPTCVYNSEWQFEKVGNYWGVNAVFTDIAIMDAEGGILPEGEVGEIVYRGPNVMNGYLKNEEATREAFAHGWFHSGDMGYFDDDGLLKFVDRKKDIIKTGGENVSSLKVESRLLDHPDVDEVAVVGLPHEKWSEAVTAFIVADDPKSSSSDIESFAREELAQFEVPKAFEYIDQLPKTATGKIQKYNVSERFSDYYKK